MKINSTSGFNVTFQSLSRMMGQNKHVNVCSSVGCVQVFKAGPLLTSKAWRLLIMEHCKLGIKLV